MAILVKISTHSLFEALAYASAFRAYLWLRSQEGDSLDDIPRWWVIAAAAMGAAIGSKVLYWLENPPMTLQMFGNFDFLLGGKTIVGGLIGGLFAVEWAKRRMGIITRTGDLFALPLCVGIPIGRIGCFLTGIEDHTAGIATTLPWGVNFGDGVMRHPTQLYEVVFCITLGVFLWKMHGVHKQGDTFRIFMVAYFAFRLVCDFLKPDIRVFAGLSSIQWACVLMLLYYSRDIARWSVSAASIQNRLTDSMRGRPDRA
jgi:phosphatidylglycerol:prolipoprotein diacylglycerol transferase